jgi:hypothetical protein
MVLDGRLDAALKDAWQSRSLERLYTMGAIFSDHCTCLLMHIDIIGFVDRRQVERESLRSAKWIEFMDTGAGLCSSDITRGFQQNYRGVAVDGFLEYLRDNEKKFREGTYYGKFCSIVQSSGTGKSRLLCEVSVPSF